MDAFSKPGEPISITARLCQSVHLPAASTTSHPGWTCGGVSQPVAFHPSLLSEEARGRALRLVRFHAANNGGPLSKIDDLIRQNRRPTFSWRCSGIHPGTWSASCSSPFCCTKHVQVRVLLPYRLFDRTGILLVERRDGYGYQQTQKKNLEEARRLMAEIDFTKVPGCLVRSGGGTGTSAECVKMEKEQHRKV